VCVLCLLSCSVFPLKKQQHIPPCLLSYQYEYNQRDVESIV
jgi:hypothetical protein